MLSGLVEPGDVHVSDAWPDHEVQVNAVTWNFVTNDGKLDWLFCAFPQNCNVNCSALGPLEQIGNVAGCHVVGRLAIDGDDDVTRMNACTIGRSANEWRNDDDFVIARSDGHTHAVILSALIFLQ